MPDGIKMDGWEVSATCGSPTLVTRPKRLRVSKASIKE